MLSKLNAMDSFRKLAVIALASINAFLKNAHIVDTCSFSTYTDTVF